MTHLSTALTHVGLLSSVDTLMNCKGRALDELLAAAGKVADVRSHTRVDPLCAVLSVRRMLMWAGQRMTNHDEQGHCVAQSPCYRRCTGRPWELAGARHREPSQAEVGRTCPVSG